MQVQSFEVLRKTRKLKNDGGSENNPTVNSREVVSAGYKRDRAGLKDGVNWTTSHEVTAV